MWVILDGGCEIGTGCGAADRAGAERALSEHLGRTHALPQGPKPLASLLIADVLNIYMREHAPQTQSFKQTIRHVETLLSWWGEQTLADIKGKSCRAYNTWRQAQPVFDQPSKQPKKPQQVRFIGAATVRRELGVLAAAIGYYHAEHGPLPAQPVVALPAKPEPKDRWLLPNEAARLIFSAWRNEQARHLARFGLIGLYTGTRSAAIKNLRWLPSTTGGWIDLQNGVIHRRGIGVAETKKRQPVMKIPDKLLPHLRRWRKNDQKHGITYVVHYQGAKVGDIKRAWATARRAASLGPDVTPHVLRHTCATWKMQAGGKSYDVAEFLGMTEKMLRDVYGHHHPDFQADAANATRRRTKN